LSLKYDVYAGSFKSLSASFDIDILGRNYDMGLEAVTEGFIGKLFPWKTSLRTTGHLAEKDAPVPKLHTDQSTWKKNSATAETDYDADGKVLKMTLQNNDGPALPIKLDATLADHSVDILSGTLALLQNADTTHKCTGKFPVYDGKRRFDVTLVDDGTEVLPHSRYSVFEGEAMRCILKVVPVAGFQPKDLKRGWMVIQNYTEGRKRPPMIWLARAKNSDMLIPVRMEIASAYGSAVASLTDQ
jgi:hypothetical protein